MAETFFDFDHQGKVIKVWRIFESPQFTKIDFDVILLKVINLAVIAS